MKKQLINDWNTQMKAFIEIFKNIILVPQEEKNNYMRDMIVC
jgi:hypothetical protein